MDREREVQWIKNYSELYECESVLKIEKLLMDVVLGVLKNQDRQLWD